MRQLVIVTSILFAFVISVNAQSGPKFNFEESEFDFGTIKEESGFAEHKFVFTNTGAAPMVIQGVRASCGCTTPAWSKEPIAPGEKGFVTARYNPKNRPGPFRKSLTVTSNADPSRTVLYIKGVVEGRTKTVAEQLPHKVGDLRFQNRSFNMSKLTTQKPTTRSFEVYNDGEQDIIFSKEYEAKDYIKVSFQPEVLKPKQKGKIVLTYDAKMKNELGFVTDMLVVNTNEPVNGRKDLRIVATIEEYFPPMTADQIAEAPKLKFEKTVHDFGTIKESDKVSADFTFTNTGKTELNIRSTKANCGCTISKLEKDILQPGESSTLHVTFNAAGRRGTQHKAITVFSNDPQAPTQRLIIKARVDQVG